VNRYLRIAKFLRNISQNKASYEFLLVSSFQTKPNEELLAAFSELAPTSTYACRNQVAGYPEGATAMFWETMDYIAAQTRPDNGFSLWLESDMIPVKHDWLDRLSQLWNAGRQELLVMGLLVPNLYRRKFLRKPRLLLGEHINGGACYSKQFSRLISRHARQGRVFDVDLFPFLKQDARYKGVDAFAFSTLATLSYDIERSQTAVLHGLNQDKDEFIDGCIAGVARHATRMVRTDEPVPPVIRQRCCAFARLNGRGFVRSKRWGYSCPLHLTDRSVKRRAA
jgi:hypothetical protein